MKTKHTPGPWTIDRSTDGRTGILIRGNRFLPGAFAGVGVAKVSGYKFNGGETPANAQLIAAAPELLAAVSLAEAFTASIDRILGAGFEEMDLDLACQARSLQSKLQTAIAKATQESS